VSIGATPSVLDLVGLLERFYGPVPMPPNDPFRYQVWETLSAQTTPGRRDAAYAALLRIPALTPDALFRAPRAKLAEAVAHAGAYQEQRIQALLAAAGRFRRHPQLGEVIRGSLRDARRAAALLPRLGEGSSHRLLLFGGDHRVFPVDRDMTRLCVRLGLVSGGSGGSPGGRRAVRRSVEDRLPCEAGAFKRTHLFFHHHAVHTCTPEPHCTVCPLSAVCAARQSGADA
jgi:endonuclease III